MKRKIVISINPEFVTSIINGTKKFEYRKRAAKSDISSIIIYATVPVKKIVAEAKIVEVLRLDPEELWNQTKDQSGITKTFFDTYFKHRRIAYAYKIGKVKVYEEPKKLADFGLKFAPQSFAYAIL